MPTAPRLPSVAGSFDLSQLTFPLPRGVALLGLAALSVLGALSLVGACQRETPGAPPSAAATRASRVIPTSASAVDFASALLEPERIVALPEQALEYSLLHTLPPRFASTARFDVYLAEPILALGPDLVLADAFQAPETTQRLRQAGVEVFTLPVIGSWRDARAALVQLGERFGRAERASELCAELDARVARLEQRAASGPRLRAVVYSSFGGVGSTAGADTTIDDVLRLAGLDNAAALAGRSGHTDLSFEALIALDPELIVVSAPLKAPPSSQGDLGGASERVLLAAPALAELRAVRERRIVALPAWLFATNSFEIVRAAELLREQVELLAPDAAATPPGAGSRAR